MGKDNTTLFDLTGELLHLYDAMSDPDYDIEALQACFEAVEGEWENKMDGYAAVRQKLIADNKAIYDMEQRLYAKRKTVENKIKRLEQYMEDSMRAVGKLKFKTTFWSYGIQKNPESVVIDANIRDIPEQYLKYSEPTADKTAIKEALKNGADLEGIAHLTQTEGLRIR